jgi:hypothetical protein
LLILGGRYGSIERTSGKSYIQLEYEYAQERGKPFFAVVVEEDYLKNKRAKEQGADVLELENPQQLKAFRADVLTRLVKFWDGPLEIKLAIYETLNDFSRRDDLIGWVPGDQAVNSGAVVEEIARLAKENASLRDRLSKQTSETYSGLSFDEMLQALLGDKFQPAREDLVGKMRETAAPFIDSEPALLHVLWINQRGLVTGIYENIKDLL